MTTHSQGRSALGRPRVDLPALTRVVCVLGVAVYLLLVPFGLIRTDNRLGVPELILIALIIVWLSGLIAHVEEVVVNSKGVSLKISRLQSQVATLQIVVKGLVTHFEYEKLDRLAKGGSFPVWYSEKMYDELDRLDAIRYIEPTTSAGLLAIKSFLDQPAEFDLTRYVKITDEGRNYLKVRGEVSAASG